MPQHAPFESYLPSMCFTLACFLSALGQASSIANLEQFYTEFFFEILRLFTHFVVHERHDYFFVVFEMILDEFVKLHLLDMVFLLLFLLLNTTKSTSWNIYLCYLALDLTF